MLIIIIIIICNNDNLRINQCFVLLQCILAINRICVCLLSDSTTTHENKK